jgi:hypothetical protein
MERIKSKNNQINGFLIPSMTAGPTRQSHFQLTTQQQHSTNFLTFHRCWWRRISHFRRNTFCLRCSYFIQGPTRGDDECLNKCFCSLISCCLGLQPKPEIGADVLVPVKSTAVGKIPPFNCSYSFVPDNFS